MQKLFTLVLLLLSFACRAQIVIDPGGDNWKSRVDSALVLIKQTSTDYYTFVNQNCARVAFISADHSSCAGDTGKRGIIFVSAGDISLGIQNIAAVLVHESLHLYFQKIWAVMPENTEEGLCYTFELQFLKLLPNPEPLLVKHAENQIKKYK
jgi:hypothetical protein